MLHAKTGSTNASEQCPLSAVLLVFHDSRAEEFCSRKLCVCRVQSCYGRTGALPITGNVMVLFRQVCEGSWSPTGWGSCQWVLRLSPQTGTTQPGPGPGVHLIVLSFVRTNQRVKSCAEQWADALGEAAIIVASCSVPVFFFENFN